MRILVTGSSGLLGAQLVRLATKAGHEVISSYNLHPPNHGSPVHLDLGKLGAIEADIRRIHPNTIIHAASVTDVDLCEEKPDLARLLNGEATGKIAEAANSVGSFMVYVSTDYVFDGQTGMYKENDDPKPINHYGESKLLGERLVRESGAEYCIARTSVLYGWGREHRPNFATWILGKLRSGQMAKVVNDLFASPTLNVDLAEMLLESAVSRFAGVLHLAGSTRIDRYNFALRLAQCFHLDSSLIEQVSSAEIDWKAKRPEDSSLNVQKAADMLKRKPVTLGEALDRFKIEEK